MLVSRMRSPPKYIVHDGDEGSGLRPFVYFVIPKVACSSVKTALLPLFGLDPTGHERPARDPARDEAAPYDVHAVFDHSEGSPQVRKGGFEKGVRAGRYAAHLKFAFVRDPRDRLASCYLQKLAPGRRGFTEREHRRLGLRVGMGFAEFVRVVHATPDSESNPHFRSQYLTVCDGDGRILADFVGRFETLAEDFRAVAQKIGAPGLRLGHLLRSRDPSPGKRGHDDLYDAETSALVAERYARDARIFGYSAREGAV